MGRTGTRKDVGRIPRGVQEIRTGTGIGIGIGIRVERIETRIETRIEIKIEMGTTRAVETVIGIGIGIVIETAPATETETEIETEIETATGVDLMIGDEIVAIREIARVRTETMMTSVTRTTRVEAAIGAGNAPMQAA